MSLTHTHVYIAMVYEIAGSIFIFRAFPLAASNRIKSQKIAKNSQNQLTPASPFGEALK
jgi:hypothetical protein